MDFFDIVTKETKGILEVRPDFVVDKSKDLMVRGQAFYAVWDESQKTWSTSEYELRRLVDDKIREYVEKQTANGIACTPKYLRAFSNGGWTQFKKYAKSLSDNSHQLDATLTFAGEKVKKTAYSSRSLPYSLEEGGECPAWHEISGTLYAPKELEKIEWAIGSVIAGDSKKIDKFIVLYGAPGSGKGTILAIISKLFGGLVTDGGYCTTFVASDLVGVNSNFASEPFKDNPLVGIQYDGDLSRIEDNSKLNAIVSHEPMRMNEKFKPTYTTKVNAMLFMGSNKAVHITDAKSGLMRRLIDVAPSGERISENRYQTLVSQVDFELGAIAAHCLKVYRELGKNYYSQYKPLSMIRQTDAFFNFVNDHSEIFTEQNGATLNQAYTMYKEYAKFAEYKHLVTKHRFREALSDYFEEFYDRKMIDGVMNYSYFMGFKGIMLESVEEKVEKPVSLVLDETVSLFDELYASQPAQYPNVADHPAKFWTNDERMDEKTGEMYTPKPHQVCSTVLSDLNTTKLHFVKLPENHIVIDFDLTDDNGKKSLELNLEAASHLPPTYTEISKSGSAIHKHYFWAGERDVSELALEYSDGVEIKRFPGNASLRRKLSKCNNVPIATISGGLPFKEKKNVLDVKTVQSERGLREQILRNLDKKVHPSTKSSIDFIKKILDDAYASGLTYDVTNMRNDIINFAADSTNQSLQSLKTVQRMKWKSDDATEATPMPQERQPAKSDAPIVIFDVEVFPNLFVVCWSYEDSPTVVKMINPSPQEIEKLFQFRLVGFYNLDYDNHILYARFMGYDNQRLYELSKRLVGNDRSAKFGRAYDLSYADIHDFSSVKMGLKKWEIELGIHHMELNFPWDEPVDPKDWDKVVDYCVNDVNATKEVLWNRKQDLVARQILADMSGLPVNNRTSAHVTKIIFGNDRNPQPQFNNMDLTEEFPGYEFDPYAKVDKSWYKGEAVGEGGFVYSEAGIHENVAVLDVASMHPSTIIRLNYFGPYTAKYAEIMYARLAIKDGYYEDAKGMLGGALKSYIEDIERDAQKAFEEGKYDTLAKALKALAKPLADALKLVINSTYGLTVARHPNEFKDPRNKDNIIAKRGALFMIDLKEFVQSKGFIVAHIKTDSIKIPDANEFIIEEVKKFGKRYGYDFDHEATYEKMCLVNDAVFIAKVDNGGSDDFPYWKAVGTQFQIPYVFKKLFSNEPIKFEDVCTTRSVMKGAMFLDFKPDDATPATPEQGMAFIGRTGLFVPVREDGGTLVRVVDNKPYAVSGTKGYKWQDAEVFKNKYKIDPAFFEVEAFEDKIDLDYFNDLAHDAIAAIEKYGSYEEFVK